MSNPFKKGDPVLITRGPLAGKVGSVVQVDRGSIRVAVIVLDREVPVDVRFTDLERPPSAAGSR
jgi:transcription antitermination factor NusG